MTSPDARRGGVEKHETDHNPGLFDQRPGENPKNLQTASQFQNARAILVLAARGRSPTGC
jgi:hypothetical protein